MPIRPQPLQAGCRRALASPPLLIADALQRSAALERALADPDQLWLLQHFDGRAFVACCTARGPVKRAAFLDGIRD